MFIPQIRSPVSWLLLTMALLTAHAEDVEDALLLTVGQAIDNNTCGIHDRISEMGAGTFFGDDWQDNIIINFTCQNPNAYHLTNMTVWQNESPFPFAQQLQDVADDINQVPWWVWDALPPIICETAEAIELVSQMHHAFMIIEFRSYDDTPLYLRVERDNFRIRIASEWGMGDAVPQNGSSIALNRSTSLKQVIEWCRNKSINGGHFNLFNRNCQMFCKAFYAQFYKDILTSSPNEAM